MIQFTPSDDEDDFIDATDSLPAESDSGALGKSTVLVNTTTYKAPLPTSAISHVLSTIKK